MILDTNALSALADGQPGMDGATASLGRIAIPVIVLGEFRYGIGRSRHRQRYEDWLARLISLADILDVDEGTSRQYARIRQELRRRGHPIPSNDTWIAALALQHGMPVLSLDRHFDRVDGVTRVAWTT